MRRLSALYPLLLGACLAVAGCDRNTGEGTAGDGAGAGAGAGAAATPARRVDPDTPALKPGRWRVVIDVEGSPPPRVQEICVTPEQARERQGLEATASMDCSERTVERDGGAVVIHAVCDVGGTKRTYDHRATGDFASDYMIVSSVKLDPPTPEGVSEIRSRTNARWRGECPPGGLAKPGA